ncbi:MAG: hypothetical protein WC455_12480 [Dehalococcoidia bacterium]|jgi:hypothetical protein
MSIDLRKLAEEAENENVGDAEYLLPYLQRAYDAGREYKKELAVMPSPVAPVEKEVYLLDPSHGAPQAYMYGIMEDVIPPVETVPDPNDPVEEMDYPESCHTTPPVEKVKRGKPSPIDDNCKNYNVETSVIESPEPTPQTAEPISTSESGFCGVGVKILPCPKPEPRTAGDVAGMEQLLDDVGYAIITNNSRAEAAALITAWHEKGMEIVKQTRHDCLLSAVDYLAALRAENERLKERVEMSTTSRMVEMNMERSKKELELYTKIVALEDENADCKADLASARCALSVRDDAIAALKARVEDLEEEVEAAYPGTTDEEKRQSRLRAAREHQKNGHKEAGDGHEEEN